MADLTLTHLRVLVEVARRGSVTAAATALGYTQSAISRQLQGAEMAAGSPLFERHARGVRLTMAGETLLEHAQQILRLTEVAQHDLARLRGALSGRIAIGAFPTAMAHVVPRALAALLQEHPNVEPHLHEGASGELIALVRSGHLHVGVVALGNGLPEYDLNGLVVKALPPTHGVGIAVSNDHPFADRDALDPNDLIGQRWIGGLGESGQPQFVAWPSLQDPDVTLRVRAWQARIGLVSANLGIAVVPAIASKALPKNVHWIPVRSDEFAGRRSFVVTTVDQPAGVSEFVRCMRSVLAERD